MAGQFPPRPTRSPERYIRFVSRRRCHGNAVARRRRFVAVGILEDAFRGNRGGWSTLLQRRHCDQCGRRLGCSLGGFSFAGHPGHDVAGSQRAGDPQAAQRNLPRRADHHRDRLSRHGDHDSGDEICAFDYLHKPFSDPAALDLVVNRALQVRQLSRRAASVEIDAGSFRLGDIVGSTPGIQQLIKEIGMVAASRATVLITGESGTGKELIARVIHNYSHDENRPFVGINCSAIVDTLLESELFGHEKGAFTGATTVKQGKFELAEDGTVFLDEIGDMSLMLQAKLLRVLQEREFEHVGGIKKLKLRARVVAATHRNVPEEVNLGRFREDLYQRLKVITLHIPPLRERREDIPLLVHHLLERINERVHKHVTRVPPEVLNHLARLPWRGNIRELENVLTRAVVLSPGEVLLSDNLPSMDAAADGSREAPPPSASWGLQGDAIPTLEQAERMLILRALSATHGHKGKACELLGISRPTLERKLQKYGVAVP